MRFAPITLGALALVLLVIVPVGGAPTLQPGSQATYKLSASITFAIPTCQTSPGVDAQTMMTLCPETVLPSIPPSVDINGTLAWVVTALNSTTATLNVTRDLAVSSSDASTVPAFHIVRSLNESIDLATRISTILPLIMPEVDQALATAEGNVATGLPASVDVTSAMNTAEPAMIFRPHIYTMWWVNGPLKANETVPVLVLPTNVTGSTSIDLGGSLGTRDAWTLFYGVPKISPLAQPMSTGTSAIPVDEGLGANFTFNYDQKSDLLLSATVDVHFGFVEPIVYQPTSCTAGTYCPAGSAPVTGTRTGGFNFHASLVLAQTNLSLDQRLDPTGSSGGTTGSTSGSGSGSSPGSGLGAGTGSGTGGSGTNGGSNPSTGSGSGSSSGQPPSSSSTRPSTGIPAWIYWIVGIIAMVVIVSGLLFARRRMKKTSDTVVAGPAI